MAATNSHNPQASRTLALLSVPETKTPQPEINRQYPNLRVNGINPFYLAQAADRLFDQSTLPDNQKTFPLFRFQQSGLMLAALYRFNLLNAPSQSGKTTLAELLAALYALAYPGSKTLILSTKDTQAERLLDDIKNKFLRCCVDPSFHQFDKDNVEEVQLTENKSVITALPHSLKALTGNPADLVILDELAKWDKEPKKIYAEAIARLGRTGGSLIAISTFLGEGTPDVQSPEGYRGNYFNFIFNNEFNQRGNPKKETTASRITLHVNPYLYKQRETLKKAMDGAGEGFFDEHYLGIPRKAAGRAIFDRDFNRIDHVKPDSQIHLDPDTPLFMCWDPGLTKVAILGQLNVEAMQLIYLREYMAGREKTFGEFVRHSWLQAKTDFRAYHIETFCDVAGNQQNRQTLDTDIEVISQVTQQYPHAQYQLVAPGVQTLRSFMRLRDGMVISEKCPQLATAFESGLVHAQINGILQREYAKDGFYEHYGDAARYPVFMLTNGYEATQLNNQGEYDTYASPPAYVNPITGY